ncbi:MAG: hypothetical protein ABI863_09005 [Ginsengibacter sp.]
MRQIIPAAFIFLFSSLQAAAQNIDSTIEKYGNDYGQERTYLHFDKSTYVPGETIWYKAYVMNGIFPADESKTMYIDWTDDKGSLLLHTMIPIVYAAAAGQFDIPAGYSAKFIHIKAYTKWMLNFDSAFLYNKDIRILTKTSDATTQKSAVIPSVQFFPEGGDAIEGVNNKIAFKANDQWGRPVKIKGIVQNNSGVFIDSLRTIHDGMGYFFISPKKGESFTSKWKDLKGTEHTSALPPVKSTGVSLQVIIAGDKRNFVITAAPGSVGQPGTLHLIGTMYQHEVFKLAKDITQGDIKGTIPAKDLPSGVLTITVFDDHWVPLAERITYINNQEYLFNPEMTVEHWGLNKRAKNEIQITVPDSLPSTFSVAVTDVDIDADSSDNIISHLLLTGEIKGQVYHPSYYFSNTSDSISRQLDLVMLTHGWRRFKWDDVTTGKFPKINYPKDTSYLTLSGKLYGALPSQLRDAGDIVLILKQKNGSNKMVSVPVKPNGTFNDPSLVLFDTTHIYYQLSKAKGLGDITVKFMEGRLPPISYSSPANGFYYNLFTDTLGNYRHYQLADEAKQLLNLYKGKVLETVTIKAKTKTPVQILDEKYASGLFSGGDGYQFDVLHDTRALGSLNIFTYLQGQVAGLQINSTSNPPSLQWRGGSPQIYLDEMEATPDMISSIPVSDVAYIKVLRPPFMGSSNGANGAIAIYTRRGDDVKLAPGKGLDNNTVSGYTSIREFYSPNYSSFNSDNDKRDVRTTIYWNPQVITTHENNKALITFYNTDVTKAFRVIIEGMTKDGRLAHIESVME